MKKSLIALAVAATVATPMAASAAVVMVADEGDGINIYGSFRPQFISSGDEKIADGGSRWGIQGSHDLGNGLASFYRLERKFSTANATFPEGGRLAYAGLRGGFGAVALGQQWTPYYTAVASANDVFPTVGLSNFYDNGGPGRAGNVVSYSLPTGMVVGGAIAFVVNGDITGDDGVVADDQDSVDATSLGLTAAAGPVNIGFGVHDVSASNRTRVGLTLNGNAGPVALGFMIEDTDTDDGESGSTPWALTGTVAGFTLQYADNDADDDNTAWAALYTHKLSGDTRVQVAYESKDDREDDIFLIRWRVDF